MADGSSPIARAQAAAMRAFDASLGDEQLAQIARAIDEQRALGAQLAPRKKPLPNGLDLLTAVRVESPRA